MSKVAIAMTQVTAFVLAGTGLILPAPNEFAIKLMLLVVIMVLLQILIAVSKEPKQ